MNDFHGDFQLSKEQREQLVEFRESKRLQQINALRNPMSNMPIFGVPAGAYASAPRARKYNTLIGVLATLFVLMACATAFLYFNQNALAHIFGNDVNYSSEPLPQTSGKIPAQTSGTPSQSATDGSESAAATDGEATSKLSNAVYRDLLKYFGVANLEGIKLTDKVPKEVALYMSKILSFSDAGDKGEVLVRLQFSEAEVSISTMENVAAMIYEAGKEANPELTRIAVVSSDGVIATKFPE
jgi:hypothetical protein